MKIVAPKKKALEEANQELARQNEKLEEKRRQLREVWINIKQLGCKLLRCTGQILIRDIWSYTFVNRVTQKRFFLQLTDGLQSLNDEFTFLPIGDRWAAEPERWVHQEAQGEEGAGGLHRGVSGEAGPLQEAARRPGWREGQVTDQIFYITNFSSWFFLLKVI